MVYGTTEQLLSPNAGVLVTHCSVCSVRSLKTQEEEVLEEKMRRVVSIFTFEERVSIVLAWYTRVDIDEIRNPTHMPAFVPHPGTEFWPTAKYPPGA